jgi:hypothetical protein
MCLDAIDAQIRHVAMIAADAGATSEQRPSTKSIVPERQNVQLPGSASRISHPARRDTKR